MAQNPKPSRKRHRKIRLHFQEETRQEARKRSKRGWRIWRLKWTMKICQMWDDWDTTGFTRRNPFLKLNN